MSQRPPAAASLPDVIALAVQRGRRRLFDGLSFALPAGTYLELVGPNGSGKSSLLRTLAGLQAPRGGRVPEAWRGQVALFAEPAGLRVELPVDVQLDLSLRLGGTPLDAAQRRDLLQRFGLAAQAQVPVRQLSQGQHRRLALAVLSATRRAVWLLDEPFNGMDADALALLRALLDDHLQRGGMAIVASHGRIADALPGLGERCAGTIRLDGAAAIVDATDVVRPQAGATTSSPRAPDGVAAFAWTLRREFALVAARPQDIAWPSVVFWMIASLFPFGLGTGFLPQAAAGVFWVGALFTMLLATGRLLEADAQCGALAQAQVAGLPLPALLAGKAAMQWLVVGLPVAAASALLGLQYGLEPRVLGVLAGSLALGTLSLAALATLFACLGLLARQAPVVSSLLAFPMFVPLLVFGAAALTGAQTGAGVAAPLAVLAGSAAGALLLAPFLGARLVALALE